MHKPSNAITIRASILGLLCLPVIWLIAASLLAKWSAPTPVIADEVPLWARLLVESVGLVGALAGLATALLAVKFSVAAKKSTSPAETTAAWDKAQFYARGIPFLIGLMLALLAIKLHTP